MKNVIIGIHGLGNKAPETLLQEWWKLSMKEGLATISPGAELPSFELVYWADILYDKPLDPSESNTESPYYIDEKYTEAPENFIVEDLTTRMKLVDFLGRQLNRIFLNDDLTLNYAFITDAIIKKYFRDLEMYYTGTGADYGPQEKSVRQLIRERLRDKLIKHRNDNIMLVSHSMGTIVAFDVLTFLAPEIKIDTLVTIGSPLGLPVVISRIASECRQKGQDCNNIKTPPGVLRGWYNFSDILDKVAFNYKLSDYYAANGYNIKPADSLVINNYELNGIRNPHKSFGYLRTPEFSKILYEFTRAEKLNITDRIARMLTSIGKNLKSLITFQPRNK